MVSQVSPLAGDICDFASKAVNSRVARVTPSGVQVATLHVISLAKPGIPESQESPRPGYRLRLCTWFYWQSREFQSRKSHPVRGAGCDFARDFPGKAGNSRVARVAPVRVQVATFPILHWEFDLARECDRAVHRLREWGSTARIRWESALTLRMRSYDGENAFLGVFSNVVLQPFDLHRFWFQI